MPRSGTTWLARLLAAAPRTALTGREPMNPRGRQYALAGTLQGWSRLAEPTERQQRLLRRAYRGTNPWVYSRYGRKQWSAPLPSVRLIVKDPFAMLSIPTVRLATGACTVLVYRHPGAALASYRRMGWSPDVAELSPVVAGFLKGGSAVGVVAPEFSPTDEIRAMAWFWNALYGMALSDSSREDVLIVSHEELALGGEPAAEALFQRLGLRWSQQAVTELHPGRATPIASEALHNLHRDPTTVAAEWRRKLAPHEVSTLEQETGAVHALLNERRFQLSAAPAGP